MRDFLTWAHLLLSKRENELRLLLADYAALMTLPNKAYIRTGSPVAATGRFRFRRKTLTYSFLASEAFGNAKLVSFLDGEGNIVEEFPVASNDFQSSTGKICGEWTRLPRRYRRQLRGHELYAQLTNEEGVSVIGRVAKRFGLASELFSGLLLPEEGDERPATRAA